MGVLKARVGGVWVPVSQGFNLSSVGYVGYSEAASSTTSIGATVVDLGASVTWIADPAHRYKTTLLTARVDQFTSTGRFVAQIASAANGTVRSGTQSITANAFSGVIVQTVEVGLSGSQTRKARASVDAGTATVQTGTFILVEDITTVSPNATTPQIGTYTPTLSGMAVGTGGTPINTANFTFIGGPNLGDVGLLRVDGRIVFGTAGQTFPTNPTLSLPSGFQVDTTTFPSMYGGQVSYGDSAPVAFYSGLARMSSATAVRLLRLAEAEAFPQPTTPFTWASNDTITWNVTVTATRV